MLRTKISTLARGIPVLFVEGATATSSTGSSAPSITTSSNVTTDNFLVTFSAGKNSNSPSASGTAVVDMTSTTDSGTVRGDSGNDRMDNTQIGQVPVGGTLTFAETIDGTGIGVVVLENGDDYDEDHADSGTISVTNCRPSDIVLCWQATQYLDRNGPAFVPDLPTGHTNVGSGSWFSGQGGSRQWWAVRLSYVANPSQTESLTVSTYGASFAGAVMMRITQGLQQRYNYELTSYGSPDYTITSFPSTGTGVSNGANDVLVAVDMTVASGDEGLLLEMGGTAAGFAWGVGDISGTKYMRARCFDGGGSFRDGSADALAAADVQVDISDYIGRKCTYYVRVDASLFKMTIYVQAGGQGSEFEIVMLESNTSNGTYTNVYGSGGKGYGQVSGATPDIDSGGTYNFEQNFNGTIDEIRYWAESSSHNFSGFSLSSQFGPS